MKIEKVNDNQIRCTLTREDLDERQLKISEIAYGTEKAKNLFRDVMQQASYEFGFEAEDIPLMIEAIPMSTGCIVFIITKVEDPEELDTRFSRFAPSVHADEESMDDEDDRDTLTLPPSENIVQDNQERTIEATVEQNIQTAEDVIDLFKKIAGKASASMMQSKPKQQEQQAATKKAPNYRIFSFDSISQVAEACYVANSFYDGESVLYKNVTDKRYYMMFARGESDSKDFIKLCNLLMEYGTVEYISEAGIAYMEEHYEKMVATGAVAAMAQLK